MTVVPHRVTLVRTISATPETLYAAWTEPDRMRQWYATVVDADVRVGGRYRIELHEADGSVNGLTGEYLELTPPPEFEPSYYDELRGGWEEWVDRLEKAI